MNARKCLAIALICMSSSIAQTRRGVIPRSAATDYSAHASQDNVQIGASLLTHKDLKKIFATDVNQCCLVGPNLHACFPQHKVVKRSTAEGNRRAIEAELREKGLPETSTWDPVAGYLYFSVPKKKKGGYELVYMVGDKKIVLPLK